MAALTSIKASRGGLLSPLGNSTDMTMTAKTVVMLPSLYVLLQRHSWRNRVRV